jgi:hypothetical protein
MNGSIPFTLLFEEACCNPQELKPVYNEELDLSVVWDRDQAIPYVTLDKQKSGTMTFTSAKQETTDADVEDPEPSERTPLYGLGTKTFTKAEGEVTDTDPD